MKFRALFGKRQDTALFKVSDPRRGEDCSFGPLRDGTILSARDRNLGVIEIPPGFWLRSSKQIRAAVLSCLQLEWGKGFMSASGAPKSIESAFPQDSAHGKEGGLLGHFLAAPSEFQRRFELFEKMEYGEFTVGCARDDLLSADEKDHEERKRDGDLGLLFVIAKSERINWLLSFYADTGDALIVTADPVQLDCLVGKLREGV